MDTKRKLEIKRQFEKKEEQRQNERQKAQFDIKKRKNKQMGNNTKDNDV